MSRPRKYPPELLDRGARLVFESNRPIAHVARDLGVPSETLRKHVRRLEADEGRRPDLLTSEEREEIKRLRKEYRLLPGRGAGRRLGTRRGPLDWKGPLTCANWWRGQDLNLRPSGYEALRGSCRVVSGLPDMASDLRVCCRWCLPIRALTASASRCVRRNVRSVPELALFRSIRNSYTSGTHELSGRRCCPWQSTGQRDTDAPRGRAPRDRRAPAPLVLPVRTGDGEGRPASRRADGRSRHPMARPPPSWSRSSGRCSAPQLDQVLAQLAAFDGIPLVADALPEPNPARPRSPTAG